MGGLVAQRALIDLKQHNEEIFNRISHTFLFGTPSDGLEKVSIVSFFKRQLENMGKDSDFIKDLRENRIVLYTSSLFFRAIAGDEDEFVTRDSSIYPFPDKYRKVVAGGHVSMVKPDSAKNDSVQIVLKGLSNKNFPNFWDTARIAVEERNYVDIIKKWEPHSSKLDDKALVQLALALDEVGRRNDAIKIIEQRKDKTTDAMGVLAGRFKRQWLYEGRRKSDAERALELYSKAYDISGKEPVDDDQALYNGINVAFMQLVYKSDAALAKKTAREVLVFCKRKEGKPDKWSLATLGEIYLLNGNLDASLKKYREAIKNEYGATAREIASMYRQARRIIEEFNDPKTAKRVDDLFSGYHPKPVDTSDIELPNELSKLVERLAENNHDIWALQRMQEGWTYGPKRDDSKKEHPDLVLYDELPESEKDYDRNSAIETIKAIMASGYGFNKKDL